MFTKPLIAVILCLAAVADSCGNTTPEESEAAKKGFAAAQPAIDALEKYQQENHSYPVSWTELRPKYLEQLPQQDFTYSYNQTKKIYVIEFKFARSASGVNECSYYSNTKKWSCAGKI